MRDVVEQRLDGPRALCDTDRVAGGAAKPAELLGTVLRPEISRRAQRQEHRRALDARADSLIEEIRLVQMSYLNRSDKCFSADWIA